MWRSMRRKSCLRYALVSLLVLSLYNISFSLLHLVFTPNVFTVNRLFYETELKLQSDDCRNALEGNREVNLPSGANWFHDYGYFYMFAWSFDDLCLEGIRDALWHPLFPRYPHYVQKLSHVYDQEPVQDHAIRRFTFALRPKVAGSYHFSIGVKGGLLFRVWTYGADGRSGVTTLKSCLTAEIDSLGGMTTHTSKPLLLSPHYIYLLDLIHMVDVDGRLALLWKTPDTVYYTAIDSSLVAPFSRFNAVIQNGTFMYDRLALPVPKPAETDRSRKVKSDPRRDFFIRKKKFIRQLVNASLCDYEPSYLSNGTVATYTGLYSIKEGKFFPDYHILPGEAGNVTLDERTALKVVHDIFTGVLTNSRNGKVLGNRFALDRIVYIEENREARNGHRYFVELDVRDKILNQTLRIADFVYKPISGRSFCFPRSFMGNRDVRINVVFTTSKEQRQWALSTLDVIANIVQDTGEQNLHVIAADFGTVDVDFEHEFSTRNLSYTILHIPGKFNKVRGINRAVGTIRDPQSIVFTIDLHIEFPPYIFDEVRKSTIYNRTVYAPVLVRLPCGKHIEYTDSMGSFWVANGFGILSMYKQDWDLIGGMNEQQYGEKWGGEDWDIIDRIVAMRYEVIQRRLPGYYHIYHSRKGSAWYQ